MKKSKWGKLCIAAAGILIMIVMFPFAVFAGNKESSAAIQLQPLEKVVNSPYDVTEHFVSATGVNGAKLEAKDLNYVVTFRDKVVSQTDAIKNPGEYYVTASFEATLNDGTATTISETTQLLITGKDQKETPASFVSVKLQPLYKSVGDNYSILEHFSSGTDAIGNPLKAQDFQYIITFRGKEVSPADAINSPGEYYVTAKYLDNKVGTLTEPVQLIVEAKGQTENPESFVSIELQPLYRSVGDNYSVFDHFKSAKDAVGGPLKAQDFQYIITFRGKEVSPADAINNPGEYYVTAKYLNNKVGTLTEPTQLIVEAKEQTEAPAPYVQVELQSLYKVVGENYSVYDHFKAARDEFGKELNAQDFQYTITKGNEIVSAESAISNPGEYYVSAFYPNKEVKTIGEPAQLIVEGQGQPENPTVQLGSIILQDVVKNVGDRYSFAEQFVRGTNTAGIAITADDLSYEVRRISDDAVIPEADVTKAAGDYYVSATYKKAEENGVIRATAAIKVVQPVAANPNNEANKSVAKTEQKVKKELPQTNEILTPVLSVTGIIIVAAAVILLVMKRRKLL